MDNKEREAYIKGYEDGWEAGSSDTRLKVATGELIIEIKSPKNKED